MPARTAFSTLIVIVFAACSPISSSTTPNPTVQSVPASTPAASATSAATSPVATATSPAAPTATKPATATSPPPTATKPVPTSTPTRPAAVTNFNPATTTIRLEKVAGGLRAPTDVTHAGDGSGRLFVVEKAGTIRIVRGSEVVAAPFLDIRPLVRSAESERGLLGLAFHPKYTGNGQFYVYYTDPTGDLVIARYQVSSDPNRANPASAFELLRIRHRDAANHNGGNLVFGPDGYLYIGMGDGGGAGDRYGNSQNPNALLAKMLRIDVNSGQPYGIPKDNPFVNRQGFRPEIWAWGLRNPWRYSFDRATGDLYIADVGQNAYEEVDFQPASSKGGENYGWNKMEGKHCYPASAQCDLSAFVAPIGEYDHSQGDCSITGGDVYRGATQPALTGAYFFADYCTGRFWSLQRSASGQWVQTELLTSGVRVSSFGEDEQGELYVVGYGDGTLYRLVAVPR